jgi:3-oxoacyl-[acyl-carrier protein] reductase
MFNGHDLKGEIALVTGAGSGIGREVARTLSQEGAFLALMDIDEAGLKETSNLIQGANGECEVYKADVSNKNEVTHVFDEIISKKGKLDILVTCAAIISPTRTWDIPEAEWDRMINVNLKGVFLLVQAALKIMRKQQSGKIVTIGSDVAKRGGGRFGGSHYAASKGAVLAFTRTVAREVAKEGISVNCVSPGPTKTPLHKGITEEQMEMLRSGIPKGRLGEPLEVANVVAFLVSDLASHIHGETVNVDGGVMMD